MRILINVSFTCSFLHNSFCCGCQKSKKCVLHRESFDKTEDIRKLLLFSCRCVLSRIMFLSDFPKSCLHANASAIVLRLPMICPIHACASMLMHFFISVVVELVLLSLTSRSRGRRREILMSWSTDMKLCLQRVHHDLNQDSNLVTQGGLVIHILSRQKGIRS